jgi:plasmid maintenance system killer protein
MNVPGFDFHPLRGFKPPRYSVHINGPWCITFEFEDVDACRVDFQQYHSCCPLEDLKVPPANRLEKLKGNLKGFYSIRINLNGG